MKKIYSATVTPLTETNEIDTRSLEKIINRNLKHGTDGFFLVGTMGEWTQLTKNMKSRLISAACDIIGQKAKILAGINGNGFLEVAENINALQEYPVDAFVLMLPQSIFSWNDPVDFTRRVCGETDRNVYFYYNPRCTGHNLNCEEIGEIMSIPNIAGIKNSSGCMKLRKELLMLRKNLDFELFEGHEWASDEALILGCDGVVAGQGSLSSNVLRKIADAVDEQDYERAKELQYIFVEILTGIYGKDLSNIWIGQKYALEKLGLLESHKTLYQDEEALSEKRKSEIENCLEKYEDILD